MKRLCIPICSLVVLLALSGIVLAAPSQPQTFEIAGYTNPVDVETWPLPGGRTRFHLISQGEASGYFDGTFQFEEWGVVDFDFATGQGSGFGTNRGVMNIATEEGQVVIRFAGQTDSVNVGGNFTILRGSGAYKGLHGQGTYDGTAGLVFTVAFTGRFHTAPE